MSEHVDINSSQTITGNKLFSGTITFSQSSSGIIAGPTITTGTIAPTATPSRIGDEYINTATGAYYKATGTSGFWNWAFLGQGATSADYRTNLVGCWDATNGPTPAINGSTLTAWNDLGSGLNHISNITNTPKYYANIQNGLPAVYFDGSSRMYGTDKGDVAQPTTHFLIFKGTSWGTGDYQYIIDMIDSQIIGKNNTSTKIDIYAGAHATGDSLTNNTTYLATVVFNGASSTIKTNVGGANTVNPSTGTNTMYPNIGSGASAVYLFIGYVMEWRVYTGALTSDQQIQVQSFLNNKWGIY